MNLANIGWRGFGPTDLGTGRRECILGCFGAAAGLLGTEWLSRLIMGTSNPWLIAPMGASAVLLFATPASPLAQPWSIVAGNLVSALIGITAAALWGHSGQAAGLAVALAIAVMFLLRCLHPPGGAIALCAILGGPAVSKLGYSFIWPVALNSGLLLLIALVFNNLSGRRYPHVAPIPASSRQSADQLQDAPQCPISQD